MKPQTLVKGWWEDCLPPGSKFGTGLSEKHESINVQKASHNCKLDRSDELDYFRRFNHLGFQGGPPPGRHPGSPGNCAPNLLVLEDWPRRTARSEQRLLWSMFCTACALVAGSAR